MPYLEPMPLLVLLTVPWPRLLGAQPLAHSRAVSSSNGPPDGEPTREDPLDRPTLPAAMAVVLACVVLFAWAVAPFGWRGH
jgi:hypothetical protein